MRKPWGVWRFAGAVLVAMLWWLPPDIVRYTGILPIREYSRVFAGSPTSFVEPGTLCR